MKKDHSKVIDKRRSAKLSPSSGGGFGGRRVAHWLVICVFAIMVVDALAGERGLLATWRVKKQYEDLSAEIARQRTENARLSEVARRLREDPAAIEELARRRHGLIRPGEKVFIVKDLAGSGRRAEN